MPKLRMDECRKIAIGNNIRYECPSGTHCYKLLNNSGKTTTEKQCKNCVHVHVENKQASDTRPHVQQGIIHYKLIINVARECLLVSVLVGSGKLLENNMQAEGSCRNTCALFCI